MPALRSAHRTEKIVGWFALLYGGLTIVTPLLLTLLWGRSIPLFGIVIYSGLGMATAAAGYFCLNSKPWAFKLLFALFLIQSVEYFSPSFSFSFIGPIYLKFGWGWASPPSRFNFNIVAIVVCVITAKKIFSLTRRSTGRGKQRRAG